MSHPETTVRGPRGAFSAQLRRLDCGQRRLAPRHYDLRSQLASTTSVPVGCRDLFGVTNRLELKTPVVAAKTASVRAIAVPRLSTDIPRSSRAVLLHRPRQHASHSWITENMVREMVGSIDGLYYYRESISFIMRIMYVKRSLNLSLRAREILSTVCHYLSG